MLYGSSSWVEHKENRIVYTFDITQSMFSSGNGTEKVRVSRLASQASAQEVVVDLYAGVGYFTLPYLIHGRAKHVYACELNPHSVEALTRAITRNKIEPGRCTVIHGDNRLPSVYRQFLRVADRVNMGLLPSCEEGFPPAVEALSARGGVLHVHGTIADNKTIEAEWAEKCRLRIQSLLETRDGGCDANDSAWQVQHVLCAVRTCVLGIMDNFVSTVCRCASFTWST